MVWIARSQRRRAEMRVVALARLDGGLLVAPLGGARQGVAFDPIGVVMDPSVDGVRRAGPLATRAGRWHTSSPMGRFDDRATAAPPADPQTSSAGGSTSSVAPGPPG